MHPTLNPVIWDAVTAYKGGMPEPPAPPKPPLSSGAAANVGAKAQNLRKRKGFTSTILTGGQGDPGTPDVGYKTLLGS